MRYLIIILLALNSCSEKKCIKTDIVEQLGQCACTYKCYRTECISITKNGYKVISSYPTVFGETVCVEREK